MSRVRMRSRGERRTPVATFEATGRRMGCAAAKDSGERENVMEAKVCVRVEWMIGWIEESRKVRTQNVAVPMHGTNLSRQHIILTLKLQAEKRWRRRLPFHNANQPSGFQRMTCFRPLTSAKNVFQILLARNMPSGANLQSMTVPPWEIVCLTVNKVCR